MSTPEPASVAARVQGGREVENYLRGAVGWLCFIDRPSVELLANIVAVKWVGDKADGAAEQQAAPAAPRYWIFNYNPTAELGWGVYETGRAPYPLIVNGISQEQAIRVHALLNAREPAPVPAATLREHQLRVENEAELLAEEIALAMNRSVIWRDALAARLQKFAAAIEARKP